LGFDRAANVVLHVAAIEPDEAAGIRLDVPVIVPDFGIAERNCGVVLGAQAARHLDEVAVEVNERLFSAR
jgi:hypothetical protein